MNRAQMFIQPMWKQRRFDETILTEETQIETNGKHEFGRSAKLWNCIGKIKRCTSESINKSRNLRKP